MNSTLMPHEQRDADAIAALERIKVALEDGFPELDSASAKESWRAHILANADMLVGIAEIARDERDRVQDVIRVTCLHNSKAYTAFISVKHIASIIYVVEKDESRITMDNGETFVTITRIETLLMLAGWRWRSN